MSINVKKYLLLVLPHQLLKKLVYQIPLIFVDIVPSSK